MGRWVVWRVAAAAMLAALLLPVGPGSTSPARAADYASARAAFQRLDPKDQVILPLMLIAVGRYNGMVSGQFNKRIHRGIMEYQASLGDAPSGILTDGERHALYADGLSLWTQLGMTKVALPLAGGDVYLPAARLGYPQATRRGLAYEAADGSLAVDLSTFPPGDTAFGALYGRLSRSGGQREVLYKVLREDFFVVSGRSGDRQFYTKYARDGGSVVGFTLAWDAAAFPLGERVAVLMSNMFFPGAPVDMPSAPDAAAEPSIASSTMPPEPAVPEPARPSGGLSTGSGFFVSDDGLMVTNNHVVAQCSAISVVGVGDARVAARDIGNDLALLKTAGTGAHAALRDTSISLGEVVYALGYPYAGTLDNGLNITNGLVSSLSGIQNDSRYLQITAAVQPGNSGGPLIDEYGHVAGVVSARLDDLDTLQRSGMLPQNVNFAIRSDFVASFLRANAVEPELAPAADRLPASGIASAGRGYTAQILCVQGP